MWAALSDPPRARDVSRGVRRQSLDGPKNIDVLEFDSSAAIFQTGLSRLARVVEQLEERLEVLERDNAALKECLQASDVLRPEAFQARLHQQKFSKTLNRHPCGSDTNLSQLLLTHELRSAIARFATWGTVRDCSMLERHLRELRDKIPRVIYVCGGFDGEQILASVVKFDPTRQSYRTLSGSSTSSDCCVCRKSPRSDELVEEVYSEGVWEQVAPMARKRAGFAAAGLTGLLYACGGYDGKNFLKSVERFYPAPAKGNWELVANMSEKRHCAVAASLGGRIYVCGGYNGEEALSSVECYDPASDTWELVEPMSQRRHGAAGASLDGKLYVCGGYDGEEPLLSVERYDPVRRIWEVMPPLHQNRNVAFAVVLARKLYVCSGCNGTETLKTMECFNPDSNTWEVVSPMEQGRHGAAAAAAGGRLFVCGGADSADMPGRLLSSVERYEPGSSLWANVTPMPHACIDMGAVSLYAPA